MEPGGEVLEALTRRASPRRQTAGGEGRVDRSGGAGGGEEVDPRCQEGVALGPVLAGSGAERCQGSGHVAGGGAEREPVAVRSLDEKQSAGGAFEAGLEVGRRDDQRLPFPPGRSLSLVDDGEAGSRFDAGRDRKRRGGRAWSRFKPDAEGQLPLEAGRRGLAGNQRQGELRSQTPRGWQRDLESARLTGEEAADPIGRDRRAAGLVGPRQDRHEQAVVGRKDELARGLPHRDQGARGRGPLPGGSDILAAGEDGDEPLPEAEHHLLLARERRPQRRNRVVVFEVENGDDAVGPVGAIGRRLKGHLLTEKAPRHPQPLFPRQPVGFCHRGSGDDPQRRQERFPGGPRAGR